MRRILLSAYAVVVTFALLAALLLEGAGSPGARFRRLFQEELNPAPIAIHGRFLSRRQVNDLIPDAPAVLAGYTPFPVYVLATSTPESIGGRGVVSARAEVTNEGLSGHRDVYFGIDNYALVGLQVRDAKDIERILSSTPTFRVTNVSVK
jgi:hypothetical protein